MCRGRTYLSFLSLALLCAGSAILLISCGGRTAITDDENTPTMRGDTLTIFESEKGGLTSKYYTPLMEKYGNAPEPYDEYKYGVEIFQYDTLGNVKSTFRANYAIHFISLDLWETKGDVVVTNEGGDRLETQQLFWNRKTGRVYSNVDSHFYKPDGLLRGESFEANEDLSDWEVRSARGTIEVDVEPTRDTVTAARDSLPQIPAGLDDQPATAVNNTQPATATQGDPATAGRGNPATVRRDNPAAARRDNPAATRRDNPAASRLRREDKAATAVRREDAILERVVRDSLPLPSDTAQAKPMRQKAE